jgi:hypothetical protein
VKKWNRRRFTPQQNSLLRIRGISGRDESSPRKPLKKIGSCSLKWRLDALQQWPWGIKYKTEHFLFEGAEEEEVEGSETG